MPPDHIVHPRSELLIGPEHGARRIFRERAWYPAGFFVGLHTHDGDESFEVKQGTVRFALDGDHREGSAGDIVFVPPGVEHGFVCLTETTIDIYSEQDMGIYVIVLAPDGTRRVEEIYMQGFPSSHTPPAGASWTPRETIRALYATTRHLL